jgi:hypothetical protein
MPAASSATRSGCASTVAPAPRYAVATARSRRPRRRHGALTQTAPFTAARRACADKAVLTHAAAPRAMLRCHGDRDPEGIGARPPARKITPSGRSALGSTPATGGSATASASPAPRARSLDLAATKPFKPLRRRARQTQAEQRMMRANCSRSCIATRAIRGPRSCAVIAERPAAIGSDLEDLAPPSSARPGSTAPRSTPSGTRRPRRRPHLPFRQQRRAFEPARPPLAPRRAHAAARRPTSRSPSRPMAVALCA